MGKINLYQEMNDKIADLLLGCGDNRMCLYAGAYIKSLEEQLESYKSLEEQGKLLIMAYEICVVSECNHCNHTERRIEETWIRPELLNHNGFYKTKEEAEAALKEMREGAGKDEI